MKKLLLPLAVATVGFLPSKLNGQDTTKTKPLTQAVADSARNVLTNQPKNSLSIYQLAHMSGLNDSGLIDTKNELRATSQPDTIKPRGNDLSKLNPSIALTVDGLQVRVATDTDIVLEADTSKPELEFDPMTLPTKEQIWELQDRIKAIATDPKYAEVAGKMTDSSTQQVIYYVSDGTNKVYSIGDGEAPGDDGILYDNGLKCRLAVVTNPETGATEIVYSDQNMFGQEVPTLAGMTATNTLALLNRVIEAGK